MNLNMNKKEIIIYNLNKLKNIYKENKDKKWNLRALEIAINKIDKYNGIIISGDQLKNEIKGIGEKISKRIDEILKTNTLKEFKIESNNNLDNLLLITGVGLVRAKKWNELGICDIQDVKEAINNNIIKSTHHIDIGIKYYIDFQTKIPRNEIDKVKNIILTNISNIDNKLIFEICGSYRRGNMESGDIDILISHPNFLENISKENFLEKIVKKLISINFIIDSLTSKGETKFMGVYKLDEYARRIDIRLIDYKFFYTSLLYFTGSKNFNLYIRNKALENNYSLNEYALTDLNDNSLKYLNSEKEIFEILKISYLSPEERNM